MPERTRTLGLRPDALHESEHPVSHRRKHDMQSRKTPGRKQEEIYMTLHLVMTLKIQRKSHDP